MVVYIPGGIVLEARQGANVLKNCSKGNLHVPWESRRRGSR